MMYHNSFYALFFFLYTFANAMQLVDSNGKPFQLSAQQAAVFFASDMGVQLKEDFDRGNRIDFSSIKRAGLKGQNIISMLSYANNPSQLTLTDEVLPEEIQLLETANVLGLPNQACARHLAARLWPLIQQAGSNPLKLNDAQKQSARALARPYAPCPAHMLEYLTENKDTDIVKCGLYYVVTNGGLDLNHSRCQTVGYSTKFGTLAGLEGLVKYLYKKVGYHRELDEVILDGHALDTFSLSQIQHMQIKEVLYPLKMGLRRLFLRKNCISELSEHQLDTSDLPTVLLDLSDNPISKITDGAFKAINGHRTRFRITCDFIISIERSLLSATQKKELQKKFYKATHTIPERWTIARTIVTYKYILAMAPIIMAWSSDPNFFNEPLDIQKTIITGMTLFWWWYLFVNRFDMRLAQLSHPTMGQSWGWGGDFHDRSWVIWPKNNAKLLL